MLPNNPPFMHRRTVAAFLAPLILFAQEDEPSRADEVREVQPRVEVKTAPAATALPVATPLPVNRPAPARPAPPSAPSSSGGKITYNQCNVEGPYIAMTYDDGPHGVQTPRLLDMLKQRRLKATFFVVGKCVAEYPEIARRIVAEGHEIANHSWSHPTLSSMTEASVRDQLERTHQVLKQATGIETRLFRPPYGAFTQRQRNWAHAVYGYRTIMWDVDTLDWKHRSPARTEAIALQQTKSGSIILAHDIHKTTVDAMPTLLDGLVARGFKFVTVSELIAMDRPLPPKPVATPGVPAAAAGGSAIAPAEIQ
jgi:peptidoglycan/xylan/chitin deacetylase (PgdA/CDA1 family)